MSAATAINYPASPIRPALQSAAKRWRSDSTVRARLTHYEFAAFRPLWNHEFVGATKSRLNAW